MSDRDVAFDPTVMTPSGTGPMTSPGKARHTRLGEEFVAAIAEARALARRGEHDRAVQHLARLTSRAPDGKLEAESRYLLARSYSALGSFSRALAEYDAVIGQARKGPVDQRALYEAGLLHSAELRRPRAAVELWERYLERYQGGLFEEEVSYLLCETRARVGDREVALSFSPTQGRTGLGSGPQAPWRRSY